GGGGGGGGWGTFRRLSIWRVPLTRRAARVDLSPQAGRGDQRLVRECNDAHFGGSAADVLRAREFVGIDRRGPCGGGRARMQQRAVGREGSDRRFVSGEEARDAIGERQRRPDRLVRRDPDPRRALGRRP